MADFMPPQSAALVELVRRQEPRGTEETIRSAIDDGLRKIYVAVPVTLTKDGDGKVVTADPGVKIPIRQPDGSVTYEPMPTLLDLPVQFDSGGGQSATFALKKGDEGLVVFASRANDAWRESGGQQNIVDTRIHGISDGTYLPGARSKPRELKDINTEAHEQRSDDGRHRTTSHPRNGIRQQIDHGKGVLDLNAVTGGLEAVAKTLTLASGETKPGRGPNTPNTGDRDLNEQLKGLAARVGQGEKQLAAVFDVVSKLRENTEKVVPTLAPLNIATQVAAALNGAPSGLDTMVAMVEGKAAGYLQTQAQQALGMFLNPTLGAVASVLNGGVEAAIAGITAQIASLAASNPVVAQVESLQRQVENVLARGAAPDVEAAQVGPLRAEIEALARDNPVVGVVQGLRDKLADLAKQAGPGLDFLGPQKRLVQGVIRSLHLAEG